MKMPSILAAVFLLAPWLSAGETTQFLFDDSPEGFLHVRNVEDGPDGTTADSYLRINTISQVTIFTKKEDGKTFYRVRVLSKAMQYTGNGQSEPISHYQDFQSKEEATNLMLRITKLVEADD